MSNCLVGQSGGPTSVINATVAGIVKANQMNPIYDHVYGGLNGIEGILNERFVDLTNMTEEENKILRQTPSSALGSCRYKLKRDNVADFEKLIKILDKYDIETMMRIVDIIYTVPDILLIVLMSFALKAPLAALATQPGFKWVNTLGVNLISIFIVFALLYWVSMARIVRGQILQLKEQEYVTAARALGASNRRIIKKHLLTNMSDTAAAYSAYQTGEAQMIKDVPTEEIGSLKGTSDFHIDPILGTYYLSINDSLEQFSDPKVREALSLSLDRNYMIIQKDPITADEYEKAYKAWLGE